MIRDQRSKSALRFAFCLAFASLCLLSTAPGILAQDSTDKTAEPDTKATAPAANANNGEAESVKLEEKLDSSINTFNGWIEALLFGDVSFGVFQHQLIDEATGEPKVEPITDGLGKQVIGADGKPVMVPVKDGPTIPFVVAVLVIGSIFFTFWYGFINIRGFRHSIDIIRGKYDDPEDHGEITHFRALTSALSATVGLGNIAGVAVAIARGGPGAVFWMMALAVFGMTAKFSSCTLAQLYRKTNRDGSISGGPMYYIDEGIKQRFPKLIWLGKALAVMFALMCIGGALGGGNMFQANQSFEAFTTAFEISTTDAATGEVNPWPARGFGITMAVLVAIVILGGIKRIGAATSKIVPLMCGTYVICALVIIAINAQQVPAMVGAIITEAFSAQAAYGGMLGVMVWGFTRAAFSNEAGLGSAAIAHSAAKTNEPVREGMVAMIGPFIDTIVICLMTALVVLITGAYIDPAPVLGDDPAKIKYTRVTAVSVDDQKAIATVEIDRGAALGIRPDDEFLLYRKNTAIENKLSITASEESLARGTIKLKLSDGAKATDKMTDSKYKNIPKVGDAALSSKFLIGHSPTTIWESKVSKVSVALDGITQTIPLGSQHDVVVGMRFSIYRDGKHIGDETVIEVTPIESRLSTSKIEATIHDDVISGREKQKGASITVHAFGTLGHWFPLLLSVCIILFAYSTMISWCYYGERAWIYLFGLGSLLIFRIIFVGFVFVGAVTSFDSVLAFSDLMILCMAFPNIIGSLFLIPEVRRRLKDYWSRYQSGEMKPNGGPKDTYEI